MLRGSIVSPILALFIKSHGLSVSEIGYLGIAGMLGWLIFEPLFGLVADSIRKKYLIIFAILGSSLIYALYPRASHFSHFAVLGFFLTSIMSAYAISVKAFTAELLPENNRGKTYGRYTAVITVGGIIGPAIGGFISDVVDVTMPFYIASGLGLFTLIAILLMKYDDKMISKQKNIIEKKESLWTKHFSSILIVRGLFMFNLLFRQYNLPIFLHESSRYSLSETQIGLFLSVVSIAKALSQSFLGNLSDNMGPKNVMVGSVGLLSFSYLGLGASSGLIPAFIIAGIQGVSIAAADMSMMLHLMNIMPSGKTGIVMGLYSEAENVGGIIASPSLGYIYDAFGPTQSVYTVASVLLLNVLLILSVIKEDEKLFPRRIF
jgi:MFS family permease